MNLSDLDKVKSLSDEFAKTVRAYRALQEHGGSFRFAFGESDLVQDAKPYATDMDASDPEYGQVVQLMRGALRRKVADIAERLTHLGVKADA